MPDPTDSPDPETDRYAPIDDSLAARLDAIARDESDTDTDVTTDIVHRDTGVRLRTNIQAGSASERVEITAETNADDLPDLITQLESYRKIVSRQLTWARTQAREANE